MGVYNTLVDGARQVQIKCFGDGYNIYNVGDQLPCDGSFIIVCPTYKEDGQIYAVVKDSIFLGLTDCPPVIIDKWGTHLVSYDAFVDSYTELVQSLSEKAKEEKS